MFHPFQVEQFLSEHEELAHYNFAESGVHPMRVSELLELAGAKPDALNDVILDYPEVRGMQVLREHIALLYEDAEATNVLVTVGASEANRIVAETLLEPGDEVIAFEPTYQQLPGNAQNLGITVKPVAMREENNWALDLDMLEDALSPKTKLIAVVNPNNPTGHILDETETSAIIDAAERSGAWILADEVYAGTERDRNEATASFWGNYERVIAINSMSKAYGLPGLRLGWLVAPNSEIDALWRRHEYTTISASMLANTLATMALEPSTRARVVDRSRRLIRRGFETLQQSLATRPEIFSVVPPQASAMSFVRYNLPISSAQFCQRLLDEYQMLVIPGSCFGLEQHFRFSSALPSEYLAEGLARLHQLTDELVKT